MTQRSRVHIPHPPARPGETPDFSYVKISQPGDVPRPDVNTHALDMSSLALSLVRVLKDDGKTTGPWNPHLEPQELQVGLRYMMMTRAFDDRMQRVQRQGKISFYIKSTGDALRSMLETNLPSSLTEPLGEQQSFLGPHTSDQLALEPSIRYHISVRWQARAG